MTSHRELDELLSQMIDGGLNAEQQTRLAALLQQDPAARARYHDQLALHTVLYWKADRSLSAAEAPATPLAAPQAAPPSLWRGTLGWFNQPAVFSLIFAAAFLWAGLTVLAVWRNAAPSAAAPLEVAAPPASDPAWATLAAARACQWGEGDLPTQLAARWCAGRRQLLAGVAEIQFDNGVVLRFEGPATFAIDSSLQVGLERGRLHAHVPPAAHGFAVATPQAHVVDLGTEFGVFVDAEPLTRVEVFQGRVELSPRFGTADDAPPRVLAAGEAALVAAGRLQTAPAGSGEWNFARAASDRIRAAARAPEKKLAVAEDTYVESGLPDRSFGDSPLLIVKRDTSYVGYDRQAWLRFDLSEVERERIQAVRLVLTPAPGPKQESPAAAADSATYRLELAGLQDPAATDWQERQWNWTMARRAILQPLAPFDLEGPGVIGRPLAIESDLLTEYVRSFPAQHATFVVRRLTSSMQFAHAFASRENPRYPAAQLQIWYTTQEDGAEVSDAAESQPAR